MSGSESSLFMTEVSTKLSFFVEINPKSEWFSMILNDFEAYSLDTY